jgi:RNA polymerase sigma-70 factor, ECF subfamily
VDSAVLERQTRDVSAMTSRVVRAADDADLIARLRCGDATAFTDVVRSWSAPMLHVARSFVGSHASAEEAVQETWLAVIRGLDRFEGRSSLRTWVFATLVNIARRQGVREHRTISVADVDGASPSLDPHRFRPIDDQWPGGWRAEAAPRAWGPETAVLSAEARVIIGAALRRLPDAPEVCEMLALTPQNQRVLLHRARMTLRQQLEDYYNGRQEAIR